MHELLNILSVLKVISKKKMYVFTLSNTVQISIIDALKREQSSEHESVHTCKYHLDMLLLHNLGTPCTPFLEISQSVPHFPALGDLKDTLHCYTCHTKTC